MSNFITSLISRHTNPANNVKPRVRGVFETANNSPLVTAGNNFVDQEKKDYQAVFQNEADNTFASPNVEPKYFNQEIGETNHDNFETTSSKKPSMDGKIVEDEVGWVEKANNVTADFTSRSNPQKKEEHLDIFTTIANSESKNNGSEHLDGIFTEGNFSNKIVTQKAATEQSNQNGFYSTVNENLVDFEADNKQLNQFSNPPIENDNPQKIPAPHFEAAIKPSIKKLDLTENAIINNNASNTQKLDNEALWMQDVKNMSDKLFSDKKPPTINVTIGRIEVRAMVQPTTAAVKNKPVPKPQMSLEDYLKKQNSHAK